MEGLDQARRMRGVREKIKRDKEEKIKRGKEETVVVDEEVQDVQEGNRSRP